MTQSAKIQLVIGALLVVLLPLVCYLDDRPKEKTARQIAWEERKEKERQEEERRRQEKEQEQARKRMEDSIYQVERQKRYAEEEEEKQFDKLVESVKGLFEGCDWRNVKVTKEGRIDIERDGRPYDEYTFTITSVNIGNDEGGLYVECIGTETCFDGFPQLHICGSNDPVFATVLGRFKKAVQDRLLGTSG